MRSIRQQLRANAVALISLVVALSSLGYNTWRNEQTEENRSIRVAGFEQYVASDSGLASRAGTEFWPADAVRLLPVASCPRPAASEAKPGLIRLACTLGNPCNPARRPLGMVAQVSP